MTHGRSTEDLIRHLASSPAPSPFRPDRAALALWGVLALGLVLFWLVFGLRADLASVWGQFRVQVKTGLPILLSLAALFLALRSTRPEARLPLWLLALPAGLALLLLLHRLSQGTDQLLAETLGQTALACITSITLLSLLPLGAGLVLLRQAAPARPALTGALLGIAAAAGAAAGYALHCSEDSPLFFISWYGLGIALTGGCGAALGHKLLRW